MTQEPFAVGDSFIHRIDPRFKIIAAAAYSFAVALSYEFSTLIAAVFISILLAGLARLNFFLLMKRISVVFGFLVFLWVLLPLTYTGDPVFFVGPVAITQPGIILSAQITLKSIAVLLGLTALIATMNFITLGHALGRLHVSGKFVHLFLMTYRYVFIIEQEYRRLIGAVRIRGFKPGMNLHTYKTYAYIIGMLFVRASTRADRVHRAMQCRGFNGRFYSLGDFRPAAQNWIFLACMTLTIVTLLFLSHH